MTHKLPYLNLGCGERFHPTWVNVDFQSNHPAVQAHNLLQGIPFADASFEAVYHAHVLEHFAPHDGQQLIRECYRVLRPGGVLRVVVPDLEQIIRQYLLQLEAALAGDEAAAQRYDWIMLELYDQAVRHRSGGMMAKYLFQDTLPQEEYVFERIGEEGRLLRARHFAARQAQPAAAPVASSRPNPIRQLLSKAKQALKRLLFKTEIDFYAQQQAFAAVGKFRLGGEVHQWMYDRYSLGRLLAEQGFGDIRVVTAFESYIPNWNDYGLESHQGQLHKPDSLFMEAKKTS
ncbi:class I SAM-dependent methyltransferase [Eisenibacter elegans]|jgi:predicted SAM-dependent methyltransferase|uniref:class I SAM-dependent methyltransferase n=1 Tax=Eisenibacter elegans TaxID=997 RepID=UPI00040C4BEB|nr:methyltransferase domain-containing protein [Eisenibacter elegans]